MLSIGGLILRWDVDMQLCLRLAAEERGETEKPVTAKEEGRARLPEPQPEICVVVISCARTRRSKPGKGRKISPITASRSPSFQWSKVAPGSMGGYGTGAKYTDANKGLQGTCWAIPVYSMIHLRYRYSKLASSPFSLQQPIHPESHSRTSYHSKSSQGPGG